MTIQQQLHALNTIPPNLPAFQAAYLLVKVLPAVDVTSMYSAMADGFTLALDFWLKTEGFQNIGDSIHAKYSELKEAHANEV